MESVDVGAFPEGEWDCFYPIFSIEEDRNTEIESMFSPTPNFQYICQESSNSSSYTVFMANDPEHSVLPNDNDFNFHMMMMMKNEKSLVPSSQVIVNEDDETSDPSQNSDVLKRNPELPLPDKKKKARVSKDRRRERINERLRTLQSLVPNGTKVDISTMLEEAVHYVKFLQLQIKLLSSDDMWMYAPIAYNGFDIGLNLSPQQH
ncbi:hypothetical protein PIB30_019390 [Stylosanthes scabra]|uniref:BHLH domain-containing protein n=1 Tax=Stylosanthes scabra TaxID=79078 RepID=A0ABU6Z511_9FABA|nr:hypothetical protein [Stylosanthes scabra]